MQYLEGGGERAGEVGSAARGLRRPQRRLQLTDRLRQSLRVRCSVAVCLKDGKC